MLPALAVAAALAASPRAQADGAERVDRRAPSPRQSVFGNVLARALNLPLREVEGVVHRARIDERPIEGSGPCVKLDGLEVTRLEFDRPGDALYYLVNVARPERTPLVVDARGKQLVMLSGERLLDADRAARALAASWADEVLPATGRPLEALRVASPPENEAAAAAVEFDSVLVLGRGGSPAWDQALDKLRAARRYAREPRDDGPRVRFVSTNHFVFEAADGGSISEVAMTEEGAVQSVGRTAARCRVLVTYQRDLLRALPDEGTPRRTMIALCGAVLGDPQAAPADQGALGNEPGR